MRLNVRIKSQGLQIPWESTSLEEDFYFIPPTQVRKLTAAEIEKQFEAEFAIWETIKTAQEVAPLEEYLMHYPNGKFSELAQFRLDRIFAQRRPKVALPLEPPAPVAKQTSVQPPTQIALAETRLAVPQMDTSNPFSKGTARALGDYKVGDSYTYRESDLLTKVEGEMKTQTVTSVNAFEVIYNDGKSVRDLLGNLQKGGVVKFLPGIRFTLRNTASVKNGPLNIAEPGSTVSPMSGALILKWWEKNQLLSLPALSRHLR